MQAQEPTETLDPPGSETLGPKTPPESECPTLEAMPPGRWLGLEAEPPATDGAGLTIGDFVWGKIRGHPWWPGRVHDPLEASADAKKSPRKDGSSVLVAYFGDGSYAWCNPSQMKPFFEDFDEFARSSSSKSFNAALDSALGEVGKVLEAQMSCNCLPDEEKGELGKYLGKAEKISDFSVEEFLDLVKGAAVDVTVVNAVEITKLMSWVVAFERGVNVGHKRKAVLELVDKIDLDVLAADAVEVPEISIGREVSLEENNRGRKKMSVAALIAQMDLDSVELSEEGEEEESGKALEAENGNASCVKDEEVGPGRRERKKSKYLSPPYCNLSGGIARSLMLQTSSVPKAPKSPRGLFPVPSIAKTSMLGLDKEEEMSGHLFQIDGLDAKELLSELLATSVNPLHLKWNRLAKSVRGFFSEFRSSLYLRGAKFEAYQKLLAEPVGADGKLVNKDVGDVSEECKKPEVKTGSKVKDIVDGEGETLIVNSEEGKKTGVKRGKKRKDMVNCEVETLVNEHDEGTKTMSKRRRNGKVMVNVEGVTPLDLSRKLGEDKDASEIDALKEGTNGMTPVTLKQPADITSGRKRGRKRKSDVDQNGTVTLTVNHVELRTPVQEYANGNEVANGKALAGLDIEGHGQLKESTTGKERKNNKDVSSVDVLGNLGSCVANGSGEGKTRQRKNIKKSTCHEEPAAIMLTFSTGSSLPTKDYLNSSFSKYGPVMQSETELLEESNCAKIVFGRSSDAEKAFNDKVAALGLPVANYRLRYLTGNLSSPSSSTVPKPPLPYIRKSLERMISTLSGSTLEKLAGSTSEDLKPETRDNLVGEMHGLLMKVDRMLTEPAAGTSS